MKVILLADVKSLGKKGDIVEVNDAYARNVLIRKGEAVEATARSLNDRKLQQANDRKLAEENLQEARELAKKLEHSGVSLRVRVGEGGKLFGAISSKEIAEEVEKQLGLTIDKKKIRLEGPIKAVGPVKVPVRLHPQVTAYLNVLIEEL